MKSTAQLLVLAAGLFAAAPVFADKTAPELLINGRDSSFTFNLTSFEQENRWTGTIPDARTNTLSQDNKSLEFGAALDSETRADSPSVKLFDFDGNDGNSFREDGNGRAWGKHLRKPDVGGNDTSAFVSEPASVSLLMLGLVGLGLLFWRRCILRATV